MKFIEVTEAGLYQLINIDFIQAIEWTAEGDAKIYLGHGFICPDQSYKELVAMVRAADQEDKPKKQPDDGEMSAEDGLANFARMCDYYTKHNPKVDVSPVVHGYWRNSLKNYQVAECSNCKKWYEPCPDEKPSEEFYESFCEDYKYCPGCGAKMDLKETKDV